MISFDMGGTSLDVCLVHGGVPPTTSIQVVEDHPVLVPSVDIVTAGAGGGSIATVDRAGRLRVGPESAGADPGPAAYGRGGSGRHAHRCARRRRDPGPTTAGGPVAARRRRGRARGRRRSRNRSASTRSRAPRASSRWRPPTACGRCVASPSNEALDPRGFTLVAFGGAGPLLAGRVMDELGLAAVVVPPHPGLFSAAGLMAASVRIDDAQTVLRPLDDELVPELLAWYRDARDSAGRPAPGRRHPPLADPRGRVRRLSVRRPGLRARAAARHRSRRRRSAGSARAFDERHDAMYGHADPRSRRRGGHGSPLRVRRSGPARTPDGWPRGTRTPPADARVASDARWCSAGSRPRRVPVYRATRCASRNVHRGTGDRRARWTRRPWLVAGTRATVDADGDLWLRGPHGELARVGTRSIRSRSSWCMPASSRPPRRWGAC